MTTPQKTIDELRSEYKEKIRIVFNKFIKSQSFEKCVNAVKLNGYDFIIAERKYKSELLDLLSQQFSKSGKSEDNIVFDVKPEDARLSESMIIDKMIDDGRMFVVLDENGKVASCGGIFDFADSVEFGEAHKNKKMKESLPKNYGHFMELRADFTKKSKPFINFESEYGKCAYARQSVTRIDLLKKGLQFIMQILFSGVAIDCGYKYMLGVGTSSSQMRKMRLFGVQPYYEMKYDKYKFQDGTNMEYYYQNLINKYNYTESKLNALKQNLIIRAFSTPLFNSSVMATQFLLTAFLSSIKKSKL